MPAPPSALGEFETLMLLAVLHLAERQQDAYGSTIRSEIEMRTGRAVARGSIYVTLERLEEKRLLVSRESEGSPARGQRPKRIFKVTPSGLRAVKLSVSVVDRMQRGLEAVFERD